MRNCIENAKALREGLDKLGRFDFLSKDVGVPLVAFSLKDRSQHDEYEVSDALRRYGWIVPAYTMAPDAQEVTLLRVVVREDFSRQLADRLIVDMKKALEYLDGFPAKLVRSVAQALVEDNNGAVAADVVEAAKKLSIFTDVVGAKGAVNKWKKQATKKTNGVC